MDINAWTQNLRLIYDKAVKSYQDGNRDLASYFSDAEKLFLATIGLKPINVYDYAEDFVKYGEPDWDTFLLIAAARRDYFLYEQQGMPSSGEIDESELPPNTADLEGVTWLPRIIRKAKCFLHGDLCHDIMYGCSGDRRFLREHNLHPADFLRAVWASHGDEQKVLAFVRKVEGRQSA